MRKPRVGLVNDLSTARRSPAAAWTQALGLLSLHSSASSGSAGPPKPSPVSWQEELLEEGRVCVCGLKGTSDTELCPLAPQVIPASSRPLTRSQWTWGVSANSDLQSTAPPGLSPGGGTGEMGPESLAWPLPALPSHPDPFPLSHRPEALSPLSQKMRLEAPVPAGPRSLMPTGPAVGVAVEASWKR